MHPSLAKAAPTPSPTSCDLFLGELEGVSDPETKKAIDLVSE